MPVSHITYEAENNRYLVYFTQRMPDNEEFYTALSHIETLLEQKGRVAMYGKSPAIVFALDPDVDHTLRFAQIVEVLQPALPHTIVDLWVSILLLSCKKHGEFQPMQVGSGPYLFAPDLGFRDKLSKELNLPKPEPLSLKNADDEPEADLVAWVVNACQHLGVHLQNVVFEVVHGPDRCHDCAMANHNRCN